MVSLYGLEGLGFGALRFKLHGSWLRVGGVMGLQHWAQGSEPRVARAYSPPRI